MREQQLEQEREEAELYKNKIETHIMETESAEEEQSFKEMFPAHRNTFADLDANGNRTAEEDDVRHPFVSFGFSSF